jgi:hypothetical protein
MELVLDVVGQRDVDPHSGTRCLERSTCAASLPGLAGSEAILATRQLLLSGPETKALQLQGFRMGGTGLEPVTPSAADMSGTATTAAELPP